MAFTIKDAEFLIKTARSVIENRLNGKQFSVKDLKVPKKFSENKGVFVSLHTFPGHELRGCIGIPYPEKLLVDAVVDAAVSSATSDPRFNSLTADELKKTVIEISILTKPEQIFAKKPSEFLEKIKICRDGLIVEQGMCKGLLLPQVAVAQNWDAEEFISHTCLKAGISPDSWKNPATKIYKFSGEVFSEETPEGKVIKKLTAEC